MNNPLSIESSIAHSLVTMKQWEKLKIEWNTIITVVKGKIGEKIKWILEAFESSIFNSGEIMTLKRSLLSIFEIADWDIILNKINVENDFWDFCRKNWKKLYEITQDESHKNVDLYRWDQVDVEFEGMKYKLNLWFCRKEVDCLFHNHHNFEKTHTGVAGDGYMQKADYKGNLVETVGFFQDFLIKIFISKMKKKKMEIQNIHFIGGLVERREIFGLWSKDIKILKNRDFNFENFLKILKLRNILQKIKMSSENARHFFACTKPRKYHYKKIDNLKNKLRSKFLKN